MASMPMARTVKYRGTVVARPGRSVRQRLEELDGPARTVVAACIGLWPVIAIYGVVMALCWAAAVGNGP
ncbi:MAG: hypothetical protein R3B06_23110 [Kofleriaceae bacterium]